MARVSSNEVCKIMVILKTETEHLCKRGDRIQGLFMKQEFCMTRLD